MINEALGKKLKSLREKMGLSPMEASKRLNIDKSELSDYENGISQPNYETLKALGKLYAIPIDYLLDTDFREVKESEEVHDLLNKISMLKAEDRALILIMTDGMLERYNQSSKADVKRKKEA